MRLQQSILGRQAHLFLLCFSQRPNSSTVGFQQVSQTSLEFQDVSQQTSNIFGDLEIGALFTFSSGEVHCTSK
jgi:hypothetical protein